jgi:hypothetical protein
LFSSLSEIPDLRDGVFIRLSTENSHEVDGPSASGEEWKFGMWM